jgi:Uma2 family endonuclease
MSATTTALTSNELTALLEEEGFERWVIGGELREKPMTLRSPGHGGATATLSSLLWNWCQSRPKPRPKVFNGDIYFRLQADPETNVGVDVALATAAQAATVTAETRFLEGPPLLAVEVMSASDVHEDVHEKLEAYLNAGTPVVWIVDPFISTVMVHRPGQEPVMFNRTQELLGDPELPGFRCPVAAIFE